MPKIIHWGFTDGHRLARTVGRHLRNPAQYTAEEFIAAAEKAAQEYPSEWVIFYSLGDKYQQVGRYADALRVCNRCVELKPNDIRSAYALATAYNVLTRAAWAGKELPYELKARFSKMGDLFDPELAKSELDKTGLDVETAVVQAIRWFERALTLQPDSKSQAQIQWDLRVLYERFPHLQR